MKQIFGYTAPERNDGEQYVKFLAVFQVGSDFMVELRDGSAKHTSLMVPAKQIADLAVALSPDLPEPKGEAVAWQVRAQFSNGQYADWIDLQKAGLSETDISAAQKGELSFNGKAVEVRALYTHPVPASSLIRELVEVLEPLNDFWQFIDANDDDSEKYTFLLKAGQIRRAKAALDKARAYMEGRNNG